MHIAEKSHCRPLHNISSLKKKKLEDLWVIFRRKYVKPESTATAKHKWAQINFSTQTDNSYPISLKNCIKVLKKAFGENATQMISMSAILKIATSFIAIR